MDLSNNEKVPGDHISKWIHLHTSSPLGEGLQACSGMSRLHGVVPVSGRPSLDSNHCPGAVSPLKGRCGQAHRQHIQAEWDKQFVFVASDIDHDIAYLQRKLGTDVSMFTQ